MIIRKEGVDLCKGRWQAGEIEGCPTDQGFPVCGRSPRKVAIGEGLAQESIDGGGSIDASELRDLMISVGQNCTESELKEMVEAADADGTGDIDFLEFAVLMAHKMTDENKDDTLKKAFAVFDASGDGFISAQEMRKIMFNLGENLQQEDVEVVEVRADGSAGRREAHHHVVDAPAGHKREALA